jgi:N-carbamoylputrescine amidase
MSDQLKLGIVQMGALEGDLDGTLEKAQGLVASAAEQGADLIALPEFFNREYFCENRHIEYTRYAEYDDGPTMVAVTSWARDLGTPIIAGVYEKERPGVFYDTAAFVDEHGEIVGKYRKTHPAAVRSLEKLYYRGGVDYPVVELAGWRIGSVICYDVWFPEAARSVALNGADLIVAPFATFPEEFWHEFLCVRAFENGVYFAGVNKFGKEMEGTWENMGRSAVYSPAGKLLIECSSESDDVQVVELDKSAIDDARMLSPTYRDRQPQLYGRVTQE